MSETTAIRRLSAQAELIDSAARAHVSREADRIGDACPSTLEQAYRSHATHLALMLMRQELDPLQRAAVSLAAYSLSPAPPMPAELAALMSSIVERWRGVLAELTT